MTETTPASPTRLREISDFLAREFPQTRCAVVSVGGMAAVVRHEIGVGELRPGGTVSGPVLMAVADVALYVAILGEIGIVAQTVTTQLSINFMRRPAADHAIVGDCRLMKLGRRLAVGEVTLFSEGRPEPVAHVVGTYAIPREGAP
jgi:acyl-coenzyme A thioesterase PaaI-like protein